jgi:hypothetical protein
MILKNSKLFEAGLVLRYFLKSQADGWMSAFSKAEFEA